MIIRQSRSEELDEIYQLVKEAFETAEESDGTEHELVRALVDSDAFVPELSLVAESEEGQLIGYILFTEIKIQETMALALAPLAVAKDWRGQGVGRALIEAGHQRAKSLAYPLSVVLGDDAYYEQFAYEPTTTYGIVPPFDVEGRFFRVCPFTDISSVKGKVVYASEFGL